MLYNNIHYLSISESDLLIESVQNLKHKCVILTMLDAGLRVTEACTLKLKNFDFKRKILNVVSLKKRSIKKIRQIPISNRLYKTLADYLQSVKIKLDPDSFIFFGAKKNTPINRKTIWRILNRYSKILNIDNLHPHALRHTFATQHLAAGTSLPELKELLGHENFDTTLIYASIPTETLRKKVNQVANLKKNRLQRFINSLSIRNQKVINISFSDNAFSVGRNTELQHLNSNVAKGINTIVIGDIGTGKSHLLEQIETDKKVLRFDDTERIKTTLSQTLLYLYKNEKNAVLEAIWNDFSTPEIQKKIQRENIINLCDILMDATEPKEYILIIDNINNINASARKALERLKDHFTIITSAREVKAANTSFIWNFEVMRIKNLNRNNAFSLINQLIGDLEYSNKELLLNHVYEQTNGNPRAIFELIDRYKREPFLTTEVIKSIRHTGALHEFDMSFLILLFLGIITALRYASRELDEPAFRLIGSIGLILLLITRPAFRNFKKTKI